MKSLILVFLAKIALIAIGIAMLTVLADNLRRTGDVQEALSEYPERYYPEVVYMLANDSIMDIHRFWGIDTITYYDWEETANALGLPTNLLTIPMYMDYLQGTCSKAYKRNHY